MCGVLHPPHLPHIPLFISLTNMTGRGGGGAGRAVWRPPHTVKTHHSAAPAPCVPAPAPHRRSGGEWMKVGQTSTEYRSSPLPPFRLPSTLGPLMWRPGSARPGPAKEHGHCFLCPRSSREAVPAVPAPDTISLIIIMGHTTTLLRSGLPSVGIAGSVPN